MLMRLMSLGEVEEEEVECGKVLRVGGRFVLLL